MSISVCIPTYNGAKFIRVQLESILCQLSSNDEVIISDDSSTDNTVEIIESLEDVRIKILKNNIFKSPIFNLENALNHASGDFIFLSDQDDIWHVDKVVVMLDYLQQYSTVVSNCNIIDEQNEEISPSFFAINNSRKGLLHNIRKNSYLGCCMAFNRTILNASLPFPKQIAMHDIWIGIISEIIGRPVFIEQNLISYRKHSSNFSPAASNSSDFKLVYKIKYRIFFIYFALCRGFKLLFK